MAGETEVKIGSGIGWRLWHDGVLVIGKKLAEFLPDSLLGGVAHGSAGAMNVTAGGVAATFGGLVPIITMGGIAAVSAVTAVMDYFHEKKEMLELYKDELAAKLKKSSHALTEKDLKLAAGGDVVNGIAANHTIYNGLRRIEDKRDITIVSSVIASLGAYGLVHAVLPAIEAASASLISQLAVGATAATVLSTALPIVVAGALSLAAYYTLRAPMRAVADMFYGFDKKTAHEKIIGLERQRENGKNITREEVFSVFVSADEALADTIKDSTGRNYDKLSLKDRRQIADHFASGMDIDRLVGDINSGKVNVTELAFTVEGQKSGVLPKEMTFEPAKPGFLKACMNTIGHMFAAKEHVHVEAQQTTPKHTRVVVEYDNPVPEVSFVERLGRAPIHRASHAQMVDQSRDQAALQQPSQG